MIKYIPHILLVTFFLGCQKTSSINTGVKGSSAISSYGPQGNGGGYNGSPLSIISSPGSSTELDALSVTVLNGDPAIATVGNKILVSANSNYSRYTAQLQITDLNGFDSIRNLVLYAVDVNRDGRLNCLDLAVYLTCLNGDAIGPVCGPADLTGDGFVASNDWIIFKRHYEEANGVGSLATCGY